MQSPFYDPDNPMTQGYVHPYPSEPMPDFAAGFQSTSPVPQVDYSGIGTGANKNWQSQQQQFQQEQTEQAQQRQGRTIEITSPSGKAYPFTWTNDADPTDAEIQQMVAYVKDREGASGQGSATAMPLAPVHTPREGGPASVRSNNPGAMWNNPIAKAFGSHGAQKLNDGLGQNNEIALFDNPVNGAAAQFALLAKNYSGMTLRAAIQKWSGGNDVDGYLSVLKREANLTPGQVLSKDFILGPQGIALAKAMARHEAGMPYPLDDNQWAQAQAHARQYFGVSKQTTNAFAGAHASASSPQTAALPDTIANPVQWGYPVNGHSDVISDTQNPQPVNPPAGGPLDIVNQMAQGQSVTGQPQPTYPRPQSPTQQMQGLIARTAASTPTTKQTRQIEKLRAIAYDTGASQSERDDALNRLRSMPGSPEFADYSRAIMGMNDMGNPNAIPQSGTESPFYNRMTQRGGIDEVVRGIHDFISAPVGAGISLVGEALPAISGGTVPSLTNSIAMKMADKTSPSDLTAQDKQDAMKLEGAVGQAAAMIAGAPGASQAMLGQIIAPGIVDPEKEGANALFGAAAMGAGAFGDLGGKLGIGALLAQQSPGLLDSAQRILRVNSGQGTKADRRQYADDIVNLAFGIDMARGAIMGHGHGPVEEQPPEQGSFADAMPPQAVPPPEHNRAPQMFAPQEAPTQPQFTDAMRQEVLNRRRAAEKPVEVAPDQTSQGYQIPEYTPTPRHLGPEPSKPLEEMTGPEIDAYREQLRQYWKGGPGDPKTYLSPEQVRLANLDERGKLSDQQSQEFQDSLTPSQKDRLYHDTTPDLADVDKASAVIGDIESAQTPQELGAILRNKIPQGDPVALTAAERVITEKGWNPQDVKDAAVQAHTLMSGDAEGSALLHGVTEPTTRNFTTNNGMKASVHGVDGETTVRFNDGRSETRPALIFLHGGDTLALVHLPEDSTHPWYVLDHKTGDLVSRGMSEAGAILRLDLNEPPAADRTGVDPHAVTTPEASPSAGLSTVEEPKWKRRDISAEGQDADLPGMWRQRGVLKTIHVTDDPARVLDAIRQGRPLHETSDEMNGYDAYGPGLYGSRVPHMWQSRAVKSRWGWLKGITESQLNGLLDYAEKEIDRPHSGITTDEKDRAHRDIESIRSGAYSRDALTLLAGQPYNVDFQSVLSEHGIEPTQKATHLTIETDGKYAETHHGLLNKAEREDAKTRGYDGLAQPMGFATTDQVAIWNPKAIVRVLDQDGNVLYDRNAKAEYPDLQQSVGIHQESVGIHQESVGTQVQNTPLRDEAQPTKKERALAREKQDTSHVQDVGEHIPGARKETAGTREPVTAKEKKDLQTRIEERYMVSKNPKTDRWEVVDTDKKGIFGNMRIAGDFATEDLANQMRPVLAAAEKHDVRPYKDPEGNEKWGIQRKVGDRKAFVLTDFASRDEAMRFMASKPYDVLAAKLPRYDEFDYLTKIRRIGPEHRAGNATPQDFLDQFGFRGVQFGKWNMKEYGASSLNHAFDAFHDLSELTGLSPKSLSLDGDLGIAFGARGHGASGWAGPGRVKAHYEPGERVINLTRENGAGSVAHEWIHAVDDYFGKLATRTGQGNGSETFAMNNARAKDLAHMGQAWADLKQEILTQPHEIGAEKIQSDAIRRMSQLSGQVESSLNVVRAALERGNQYRKKAPATAEQLAKFDALADKIRAGEPGAKIPIGKQTGRYSFLHQAHEAVKGIDEIYKQVMGHALWTAQDGSRGRQLVSEIDSMLSAAKSVAEATTGKTVRVASDYLRNARDLDASSRASSYFSLPHELLARAFQSYLEDKMRSEGRQSDYLNTGGNKFVTDLTGKQIPMNPQGIERANIDAAFDRFFDALRTHEKFGARDQQSDRPFVTHETPIEGAAGAFKSSERPTGVNTRTVTIDKPGNASAQSEPSYKGDNPLYKRYFDAKDKHPNDLVAMRVGDFYEFLGKDAETASKSLGITLTKRESRNGESFPMTGVPFHRLERSLKELRDAGRSVTVLDEYGDVDKAFSGESSPEPTAPIQDAAAKAIKDRGKQGYQPWEGEPVSQEAEEPTVVKYVGNGVFNNSAPYNEIKEMPRFVVVKHGSDFEVIDSSLPRNYQTLKIPPHVGNSMWDAENYVRKLRDGSERPQYQREPDVRQVNAKILADYPELAEQAKRNGTSPITPEESPIPIIRETHEPPKVEPKPSKKERVLARTGMTKTQEDFLASHLREAVASDAFEGGKQVTIDIPNDGSFTVDSPKQASALHKAITREPIEGHTDVSGMPGEPKGSRSPSSMSLETMVHSYGSVDRALEAAQREVPAGWNEKNPTETEHSPYATNFQNFTSNDIEGLKSVKALADAMRANPDAKPEVLSATRSPYGSTSPTRLRVGDHYFTVSDPTDVLAAAEAEVKRNPAPDKNTIFTQKAYDAAVGRRKGSIQGKQRGTANISPQDFADLITIGGYHLERGVRNFADWAKAVTEDLGEHSHEVLTKAWDELHQRLGLTKPEAKENAPESQAEPVQQGESEGTPYVEQTSHAATKEAFESRGMVNPEKGKSKVFSDIEERARKNYDPLKAQQLAAEIESSKRGPTPEEQATLGYHVNTLFAEKDALDQKIREAKERGETPDPDDLKNSAAMETHLEQTGRALNKGGSALGQSLGYRAYVNQDAYSKPSLLNSLSSILGDKPFEAGDVQKVGEYADKIAALEKKVAELESAKPKAKPTDENLQAAKQGKKNRIVTLEDYEAARKQLRELTAKASAGIDPEIAAVLGKMAVFHIERGVRTLAELIAKVHSEAPSLDRKDVEQAVTEAAAKHLQDLQRGREMGQDVYTRGTAGIEDPEVAKARAELARMKSEADNFLNLRKPKNFASQVNKATRAAVLSSLTVFPHLLGATIESAAADVATLFNPLNYIPSVRKATEGNVIPETFLPGEVLKGFQRMFSKQTLRDMWNRAASGAADTDLQYGKGITPVDRETWKHDKAAFLEHMSLNLHNAAKAPAFFRAFAQYEAAGLRALKSRGETLSQANHMMVQAAAYSRALESVLLNENKGAKAISDALKSVGNAGPGGQAVAAVGHVATPVKSVPMNIAGRELESTFGLPAATVKAIQIARGKASPEQWNQLVKLSSRGMIGAALLAVGILNRKEDQKGLNVSGSYSPATREGRNQLSVGGVQIPSSLAHGPYSGILQLGATIGNAYDNAHGGKDGGLNALFASAFAIAEQTPVGSLTKAAGKLSEGTDQAGAQLGQFGSEFIPAPIAMAARAQDQGAKHKPRGFTDSILMQIPKVGNLPSRQDVPGPKKHESGGLSLGNFSPRLRAR